MPTKKQPKKRPIIILNTKDALTFHDLEGGVMEFGSVGAGKTSPESDDPPPKKKARKPKATK